MFLSSFFSITHNSKTIWCVRILYIPNDCSVNKDHFLFEAVCALRLASYGLKTTCISRTQHCFIWTLLWLLTPKLCVYYQVYSFMLQILELYIHSANTVEPQYSGHSINGAGAIF